MLALGIAPVGRVGDGVAVERNGGIGGIVQLDKAVGKRGVAFSAAPVNLIDYQVVRCLRQRGKGHGRRTQSGRQQSGKGFSACVHNVPPAFYSLSLHLLLYRNPSRRATKP